MLSLVPQRAPCFAVVFLLSVLSLPLAAQSTAAPADAKSAGDPELSLESTSHLSKVEEALLAGDYDELDRIADLDRREKSRLAGGDWKLHVFYSELDRPLGKDQGSEEHLQHLEAWVKARPESITARVALATSYTRWAWVARGHDYASKVTPEASRLFHERTQRAAEVLASAQNLKTMCPQWYLESQAVQLAQGASPEQARDLFERAVQFEPGYFYVYGARANYLLPKWYGKDGDAARFMGESADKLGSDQGDLLYFQMATYMIRRGSNDVSPKQFDWQRIQRGYAALVTQYGATRRNRNELAFMAWRYGDAIVAHQQFAAIGDNWSRSVWFDRESFDRARDWSLGKGGTTAP